MPPESPFSDSVQIVSKTAEVLVLRSREELEQLRGVWAAWGGQRDSDIDFVLMIIESYPEAERPHVICLYRDGMPDAILIGRLEKKRLPLKVGYLTLFQPEVRCLNFVYGALRGNGSVENTELLIRKVAQSLSSGEAELAYFELMPVESTLYTTVLGLPSALMRDSRGPKQLHDVMDIPESIEIIYKRMSSDRRAKTRRYIRKLEAHPEGKLSLVCYSVPDELDRMFADAEQIARKTYQRGLNAGFSDTPAVRKRLELAAAKGWLRAYIQYLGDRPISFWIGMLYGDTFYSEYMGYDTELRSSAPGTVLLMKAIDGLCSGARLSGVTKLDFGLGHAEYKGALCTQSWNESAAFIFGPSFKGLLVKFLRSTTLRIDYIARRALGSTPLLPRLKRAWRDRLARRTSAEPHVAGQTSPGGDSELD